MGQFLLLLWKNWTLQKRRKVLTVFEIGLPTLLALVLLAIRQTWKVEDVPDGTQWNSLSVDGLPSQLVSMMEWRNGMWRVGYCPNKTAVKNIMNRVSSRLNVDINGLGFADEDSMVKYLATENDSLRESFLAGITFENIQSGSSLPDKVSYKIRPKSEQQYRATVKFKALPFISLAYTRTFSDWLTSQIFPRQALTYRGYLPRYYLEGFLSLQRAVDVSIIEAMTNDTAPIDDVILMLERFPYPPHESDDYFILIRSQLPFIIMLSFIVTAACITKDLVLEKERKLKEFMKVMGLRNWQHWLAWFIKYLIFTLISVAILILFFFIDLGVNGAVLNHSDPSLILVFFLLYCIATILFCFAVSTVCTKASFASAAGAGLFLASYLPYFFFASRYEDLNVGSKSATSVLHNTAMAFGCYLIGLQEGRSVGVRWDNFHKPINVNDDFTMLHVMIMLIIDSFIYALIAWYVDRIKPGDYGSPLPFYFPFTKSYWCGSVSAEPEFAVDEAAAVDYEQNSAHFETLPANTRAGIRIRNLGKVFKKDGKKKVAVNGMTLDMCEGQITALLGHNGAGKTTTMFMLTGFSPPTSGTAYINDYNIRRDLDKVRQSLGLCPQHNVLFDTMTVKEHLYFFGRLKGIPAGDIDNAVTNMIRTLDLVDKIDVASMRLSESMKRKLSVGIALIGDSKVVILDEPTSGMDPQARRGLWDILQEQRAGRTMILSTHFMDEADFLGDRIAIMAEGQVQCCGTSLFLKSKYGKGYHLVIVKEPDCDVNRVMDVIKHYVPDAEMESNLSAELSFVLPKESSSQFEGLFSHLEDQKSELSIASFGASVTTMEEVFLKVGESVDDMKLTNSRQLEGVDNPTYGNDSIDNLTATNSHKNRKLGTKMNSDRDPTIHFETNSGIHLLGQQFRALLQKRVINSWRKKLVTFMQFCLPIFFTAMGCMATKSFPGSRDPPAMDLTMTKFDSPVCPYAVVPTTANGNASSLANQYKALMDDLGVSAPFVNDDAGYASNPDIRNYLTQVGIDKFSEYLNNYMVAASFAIVNDTMSKFEAFFNNEAYHTPAITLNIADNTLLKLFAGSEKSLETANHPLPRLTKSRVADQMGTAQVIATIVSYNLLFGLCFLIGSFVLFIIKERESKAKHIQYVSGVHGTMYWFSSFVWDLINFMLPALLCVLVLAACDIKPYYKDDNAGYVILILFMYGCAIVPYVYLMSFMFTVPSSGNTWVTVINLFLATACLIVVNVLRIPSLETKDIGDALEWAFLTLVPSYCFLAGVRGIYSNYENLRVCNGLKDGLFEAGILPPDVDPSSISLKDVCSWFESIEQQIACCPNSCEEDECIDYRDNYADWEDPGVGRPLFFLFIQCLVCFLMLFFIDSGLCKSLREKVSSCLVRAYREKDVSYEANNIPLSKSDVEEGNAVKEEHHRIMHTSREQLAATDALVLAEIKKHYGKFLAVNELTLGVPHGECFGLLGAGKTTTFKMLTGDETLSGGDASLQGYSVKTDIKKAQHRMGYCPQVDALVEVMTVKETLMLYGRLRGIQEEYLPQVVDNLIACLLLEDHVNKRSSDLSGGNKRMLSTAVALIGDPAIVLLDEPSTGMDPVARRVLWDALTKVRATGRTLVLASHNMEECEALCTRLAIMVNGKLKCLGNTQMLKSKFEDGYTLMAKIGSGYPADVEIQTSQLISFVESTFAGSKLKDRHQGFVHYHIPSGSKGWAEIFGIMERSKSQLNLEDYSVSQTTLEQVFLNFARGLR